MPSIKSTVMQRQAPLRTMYKDQPEKALIIKQVRTASLSDCDALHGTVVPGDSYDVSIKYGIDRAVGGYHDAPNPGELLCAALAACQDATIRMVADVLGVVVEDLEVEVRGYVDVRASIGMAVTSPVEFQTMKCTVNLQVAAETPPVLIDRLLTGAERCCINLATLKRGVNVDLKFDVNPGLKTTIGTERHGEATAL
jgi:uncharacterized OsmC-like protein